VKKIFCILFSLLISFILVSCGSSEPTVLRLATTTSTENTGLLAAILPAFEEAENVRVDVVAVGTGQAITLGEAGDADVILVHARTREDEFVAAGHGTARYDVMFNDFILVGPKDDQADILGMALAADALAQIAMTESPFASRGDDSGTHSMELSLWEAAGVAPDTNLGWYASLGQGMGSTLTFADETNAYTLTDRGTFLAQREHLPNLVVMVGGNSINENKDQSLLNPYGVIPVNPDKGGIAVDATQAFVTWLTSVKTQQAIAEFGSDTYGQPLFYPDSQAWRER
jgi:tungstate transport system substrate-binding protein